MIMMRGGGGGGPGGGGGHAWAALSKHLGNARWGVGGEGAAGCGHALL